MRNWLRRWWAARKASAAMAKVHRAARSVVYSLGVAEELWHPSGGCKVKTTYVYQDALVTIKAWTYDFEYYPDPDIMDVRPSVHYSVYLADGTHVYESDGSVRRMGFWVFHVLHLDETIYKAAQEKAQKAVSDVYDTEWELMQKDPGLCDIVSTACGGDYGGLYRS